MSNLTLGDKLQNTALSKMRRRKSVRLALVSLLSLALSACLGANIDQIVQRQCPSIAILNTADVLRLDGASATLSGASLSCSIDRDAEDMLLATVTLTGSVSQQQKLPFFVAVLDADKSQLARTQFAVTAAGGAFSLALPPVEYGKKGDGKKPRLVAGFVLTPAQLAANRAAYRKKLGLGE
jgi:hypothetical protein